MEQISIIKKEIQPNINTLLGGKDKNPLSIMKDEIIDLVKNKADFDDLIKIQETKTNKEDTIVQMQILETIQRMLKHIIALFIE